MSSLRQEVGQKWPILSLLMIALLGNYFGASLFSMKRIYKLSKEIINERLAPRDIRLVGDYQNNKTKTIFSCKNSHTWMAHANSVLSGSGCPKCSNNCPEQSAKIFFDTASKKGYTVIGEYKKNHLPVDVYCPAGHRTKITPNSLKSGQNCRVCAHNTILTQAEVNKRLSAKGVTALEDYTGSKNKFRVRCEKCGHEWMAGATSILHRGGCGGCAGTARLTKELVNKKIAPRKYIMLGDYTNNRTKVDFLCPSGHIFWSTPNSILVGYGCSSCNKSGFNISKAGVLYAYHLIQGEKEGIGFGISNKFKRRRLTHARTFRETNTKATFLGTINFESGFELEKTERLLKQHPEIFNFGIDGFRTECLPITWSAFFERFITGDIETRGKIIDFINSLPEL